MISGRYKTSFLQINIVEEHRDYRIKHRFIWLQEFNLDENIILCFERVVFELSCSPFLLNATVKSSFGKVLLNRYADDLNKSFDNIKDAKYFLNTQLYPSDVQNRRIKLIVKYLELIGILIQNLLSLNLIVYLKILIMKLLLTGTF